MKAKLLLFALFAFLLVPALALAGEPVASPAAAAAVVPPAADPVPALTLLPLATTACAAADPITLAFLPIGNSLVCGGINYPGCNPGGSCQDPCCYCECRADGQGPGICSFECCLGH